MRIGKILGALVLSLGMLTAPVAAEETENTPYTYTVRIYKGNHGHFKAIRARNISNTRSATTNRSRH